MGDKRFEDRVKRIKASHSGGIKVDLIAGEGDVNAARQSVKPNSVLSGFAILGAVSGYAGFRVMRDMAGFDTLLNAAPPELLQMGLAQPVLGATALGLAFCALFALMSIFTARRAPRMASFSLASMGAVIGGSAVALMA